MASTRRIGILTGGGDVPGLNAVIKSVVYRSTAWATRSSGSGAAGRASPTSARAPSCDSEYVRPLDRVNTRTIDRTGGTWLHTSRTNPRKMRASTIPDWIDRERLAGDGDRRRHLRPDPASSSRTSTASGSTSS